MKILGEPKPIVRKAFVKASEPADWESARQVYKGLCPIISHKMCETSADLVFLVKLSGYTTSAMN